MSDEPEDGVDDADDDEGDADFGDDASLEERVAELEAGGKTLEQRVEVLEQGGPSMAAWQSLKARVTALEQPPVSPGATAVDADGTIT